MLHSKAVKRVAWFGKVGERRISPERAGSPSRNHSRELPHVVIPYTEVPYDLMRSTHFKEFLPTEIVQTFPHLNFGEILLGFRLQSNRFPRFAMNQSYHSKNLSSDRLLTTHRQVFGQHRQVRYETNTPLPSSVATASTASASSLAYCSSVSHIILKFDD